MVLFQPVAVLVMAEPNIAGGGLGEALADGEMLGELLAEGLTEDDGDSDLEALELAEALGETEAEGDKLLDTEADGLREALGERDELGLRLLEAEAEGEIATRVEPLYRCPLLVG